MTAVAQKQASQLNPLVQTYLDLSGATDQSDRYFTALIARDRIDSLLKVGKLALADISAVAAADCQFRKTAATLKDSVSKESMRLRSTIRPAADAWWWHTPSQPSWRILSGALLALTAAFATSFARDTLARNPDAWGVLAVAAQAGLTFVAGSTFTAAGKRWLETLATRTGVLETVPRLVTIVAATVTAMTVLTWLYVPDMLAGHYNQQALDECSDNTPCNNIPRAMKLFRRATSLDKSSATASKVHFNFGRLYELAHDYPSAIDQYQRAVQDDPDSPSALNNWAWLLLLQEKDLPTTLRLLDEAVERVNLRMTDGVAYHAAPSIYKNRGIANLRAGFPELAERDLKTAIALQQTLKPTDAAAPHCSLAVVIKKADGRRGEAIAEAKRCVELSADTATDQRSSPKIDPISFRTAQDLLTETK